jgi:hypothetical protein
MRSRALKAGVETALVLQTALGRLRQAVGMAFRRPSVTQRRSKPIWKRPAPAKAKHTHLTPRQKAGAKARAQRAGHRYPNLIDNIRAARARG